MEKNDLGMFVRPFPIDNSGYPVSTRSLRQPARFWYDSGVDTPAQKLPLLTAANAAFMTRYTSMNVAGRDAQNRPALGRGLGCRISDDRHRVTVFLSESHAAPLLQCLRQNGVLAMAVTRPATHDTLQLKGHVTDIRPATDEDHTEMTAYRESFVAELSAIGYPPKFTRTLLVGADHSVAVCFEVTDLFNQTPGPKAGEKLGRTS